MYGSTLNASGAAFAPMRHTFAPVSTSAGRDPAFAAEPKIAFAAEGDVDPHQAVDALQQDTAKALQLQPGWAVCFWASLKFQRDAGP